MNILINLAPLKVGGGQIVEMNLINGLQKLKDRKVIAFVIQSECKTALMMTIPEGSGRMV